MESNKNKVGQQIPSTNPKNNKNMKTKDKIEELFQNQTYILEAVKNLNERLTSIEERLDGQRMLEVKEILESQAIIDEIVVKNTDDINEENETGQ